MFCPDCGRESKKSERFCPSCGYPLELLEKRLVREKEESIGWVERILTKPPETDKTEKKTEPEPVIEEPSVIFEPDFERKGNICQNCGKEAGFGVICPHCGDRLPNISINDPYITTILKNLISGIFGPRRFAVNFPYPVYGGTMVPLLYPGIFASIFITSIPFLLSVREENSDLGLPSFAKVFMLFPLYIIFTPILVYLTAGFVHIFGMILGGHAAFPRTLRVCAAAIILALIAGTILNIAVFGVGWFFNDFHGFITDDSGIVTLRKLIRDHPGAIMLGISGLLAWEYAWMYGGLFRLSWWKTIIHAILTFWVVIIAWTYYVWAYAIFSSHSAAATPR